MSEAVAAGSSAYDIPKILAALPHRYPMLLVDRVVSIDPEAEIHAIKAVSFNEGFFQGHFPGGRLCRASCRSKLWPRPPESLR